MRARRTPVIDEYVEDGESAVFVDGQVIVLSEVPTLVLSSLHEEWRDLAAVEPVLLETFGAPEQGTLAEALAGVVETLASHGLVEVDVTGTEQTA